EPRVAAAPIDTCRLCIRRQNRMIEGRADEPRRVVTRQRRERDRRRVPLAAAPAGIALVQLGPRAAENEQRDGAAPVGEVLEELDERGICPVQILEDGDERTLECYVFEKAPPCGE